MLAGLGIPIGPEERDGYERAVGELTLRLGEAAFARMVADGGELELEGAVAEALAVVGQVTSA